MKTAQSFLPSAISQFKYYKTLGEKTFAQLPVYGMHWQQHPDVNSIAIIIQHLWGNMRSRWTDFLTTDGEKEWRKRDEEFEEHQQSNEALMLLWEEGWKVLFDALESLSEDDLDRVITIRQEPHSVVEAITRQLCHYGYHVGQIVIIGKMLSGGDWISLSIPKKGK